MRWLLLLLMLQACGSEHKDYYTVLTPNTPHKKDVKLGEFAPYVQLFLDYSYEYGSPATIDDLIVVRGDIEEDTTMGECRRGKNSTPRITIDNHYWDTITPTRRILLMFHELGHCVLHRNHNDYESSIMNSYLITDSEFTFNFERIMGELFDMGRRDEWQI